MDRNQAIQSQFGAAAAAYRESSYHRLAPDLDVMLAAAAPRGDERVLDLGTGTGHTALSFAPLVAEVVAVDLTEAMLDQARGLARERGVTNVRFELGDAEDLPFPDGSFDLATCRVCAHHFAHPERAVREAARVLKPDGRVLLVDSVSPDDPAQDTFLNTIELLRDPSHVRNYSVGQWLRMLSDAGFEAEWRVTWPVALAFDEWVARMRTPEPAVTQLRALFAGATDAVREVFALRVSDPWGFDIPIGFWTGRLRAS